MQALVKTNYQNLEAYGCNAHLFDLLGKHFTPSDLQNDAGEVQKYFRNHHKPSALLKEEHGKRPVLPATTRWNSQIDSFKNYCDNHATYLKIERKLQPTNTKDEAKLDKIRSTLNDAGIYRKLKDCISIMDPICIALDQVE